MLTRAELHTEQRQVFSSWKSCISCTYYGDVCFCYITNSNQNWQQTATDWCVVAWLSCFEQRSYYASDQVSAGMGDHLRAGKPSQSV